MPFVPLSASATDDGGDDFLRYTWTVVSGPSLDVTFSPNGTRGAAVTHARFPAVGRFRIRVSASDVRGASSFSDVGIQVPQVVSSLTIEPPEESPWLGGVAEFRLRCIDQFGAEMQFSDAVEWSVNSGGEIDEAGRFTGTAIVFESQIEAQRGILTGQVRAGHVVVIRFEGRLAL